MQEQERKPEWSTVQCYVTPELADESSGSGASKAAGAEGQAMEVNQRSIQTSSGEATFIEYPGHGRDVLALHAPGLCAASFELVATHLRDIAHVYSVDLPAHGPTKVPALDASDTWRWTAEIIERLGLVDPLLVGCDISAFTVTAVAAARPELAAAVVGVGGICLRTREASEEHLEFLTGEDVIAGISSRMCLGAVGPDEVSRAATLNQLAMRATTDWLINDRTSAFADKISHITLTQPDGSWVRRPTPVDFTKLYTIDPAAEIYPERDLLRRLQAPCHILVGSESMDADVVPEARGVFHDDPGVQIIEMQGGNALQMTNPPAVAGAIAALLCQL